MENKSAEDMAIETAAREGELRLLNERKFGAAVLLPKDPFGDDEVSIMKRQEEVLTAVEIKTYHMTLYRRVAMFLDFWDNNVGDTEDFPIMLLGESDEALDLLDEQIDEMRAVVGMLTEL